MTRGILELVQVKLIEGKASEDLALGHEGVSSFLKEQPGFTYRSISKRDDDSYIDVVYWNSLDSAKRAGEVLMQDSRGEARLALCDIDSVSMQHLPILSEAMSSSCEEVA